MTSLTILIPEHFYSSTDVGGTVDVYLATGAGATLSVGSAVVYQAGNNGLAAIDPQLSPIGLDAGGPIAQVSYTPSAANSGTLTFSLSSSLLAANPILAGNLLAGLQNGMLRFLLTPDTAATSYEIASYSDVPAPGLNLTYDTTPHAPIVNTPTSSSVTLTSANLGGNVSFDGGSQILSRGVVYAVSSLDANPQVGDPNATVVYDANDTTGVFTDPVSGLMQSTIYSFRAFATNSVGTTYSTASTFDTVYVSTLTLTSDTGTAAVGGTVNFTATLSSPATTPTGTVSFYANGVMLNSSPINVVSGTATYASPVRAVQTAGGIVPGIDDVSAIFTPSGPYTSSTGEIPQSVQPNAFGSGDYLVDRVGDGTHAMTAAGNRFFIDEYTDPTPAVPNSSVLVQSIVMPTIASGNDVPVLASGAQSTDGQVTLSADGQYAYFLAYNALPTNTATLTSTSSIPRVVGRINLSTGEIDTYMVLIGAPFTTAQTLRGVSAAADGSLYISTNNGVFLLPVLRSHHRDHDLRLGHLGGIAHLRHRFQRATLRHDNDEQRSESGSPRHRSADGHFAGGGFARHSGH